jgi:hypothetical protein
MTSPLVHLKVNVFTNDDKTSQADTNSKCILLNGTSTYKFIHKEINIELLHIIVDATRRHD